MTDDIPEQPVAGRLEYPGIELGSATIDLDTGELVEPVGAAAADSRKPSSADETAFAVQRVDMPAARWEENARALLKLALELAYEVKSRCKDPIHDEQIASLRALETEWAGSGHIKQI